MLTHTFGSTAVAVGTVIAAFMSGLTLGSWILGRVADRIRRPLLGYAALELGVALTAFGAQWALERIPPVYLAAFDAFGGSVPALAITRFLVAFVAVLVPTFLMGGTLPVLARFVLRAQSTLTRDLSALYAVNTLGAVAGTLAAGFYLVGELGLHATALTAVFGNIFIGVLAVGLGARTGRTGMGRTNPDVPKEESPRAPGRSSTSPLRPLLLLALAISGFTSFAYEIYWTRSLVFLVGNSTYAVSTMLASFLGGIALGGFLVRFAADRVSDRISLFGWIQILLGIFAAAVLPVLFQIVDPVRIREFLIDSTEKTAILTLARFGIAAFSMLIPATLIGTTFPLVARIAVVDLPRAGSSVGRVYAANTAGNVAGALLPGLLLLNWLGVQRGILLMATLNALLGTAILLGRTNGRSTFARLRPALSGFILISALFILAGPLSFQFPSRNQKASDRVLYYREGPLATTKVFFDPETRERSMSVDGVTIGGNGAVEFKQHLLAHLPKILLDDTSRELSIGLGSGILAGESARHQGVQQIVCVEIEPTVVAGAAFFKAENHRALQNPKISIITDDILNYLHTTSDRFQVISADEKTLMDFASNGFSYSRDYYLLLRDHLAHHGMVVQWVPTELPPRLFQMVLRTFADTFENVLVWYAPPAAQPGPTNTILLGSSTPIDLGAELVLKRLEARSDALDGLIPYGLTSAGAILGKFIAEETAVRELISDSPINTLDHPRYEFYSPRDYAMPIPERVIQNQQLLVQMKRRSSQILRDRFRASEFETDRIREAMAAEEEYYEAYRLSLAGAPQGQVFRRLEMARAHAPWNQSIGAQVYLHYRTAASTLYHQGGFAEAARMFEHAISIHGSVARAHSEYAVLLHRLGERAKAIRAAHHSLELDPAQVMPRRLLADLFLAEGRLSDAASQLQTILEIDPEDRAARALLERVERELASRLGTTSGS